MNLGFLRNCATLGYIGYLPAPGTCASLVTIPVALFFTLYLPSWYLIAVIMGYCVSYSIVTTVLSSFGEPDPSCIVLDEVIGCLIALYALPFSWIAWVSAFVFFRFFDINKFGLVALSEKASGATGIMLDDLVAGVLSNLCVHLLLVLLNGGLYAAL